MNSTSRPSGELPEQTRPTASRRASTVVELEPVAVALGDAQRPVGLGHLGARQEGGLVGTEPHGAALVGDVGLVGHQVDDRVRGQGVEFTGVGPVQLGPVPGHRDDHHLQAQAQPQAGNGVVAGVARGRHHALDPADTETTRDDDAVERAQAVRAEQIGHLLGVDPVQLHLGPVVEPGRAERLDHRHVGVGHVHVLADDPDLDPAGERLDPAHELSHWLRSMRWVASSMPRVRQTKPSSPWSCRTRGIS